MPSLFPPAEPRVPARSYQSILRVIPMTAARMPNSSSEPINSALSSETSRL